MNSNSTDLNQAIADRGLMLTAIYADRPRISEQDASGAWSGYNIDIARTIAEQLTGSPDRVAFLSVDSIAAGFSKVSSASVDLGLFNSTATLSRDLTLGVDFSQPYFIDSQGILVTATSGVTTADELKGATIGVLEGSTTYSQLQLFLNSHTIEANIKTFTTVTELMEAMRSGAIQALSTDRSILFSYQSQLEDTRILDEMFSEQPLAAAVPENQSAFSNSVTWITQTPIEAERLNISAANLPNLIEQSQRSQEDLEAINLEKRSFLELGDSQPAGSIGKALGLTRGFTQKVIARLGNAAELWNRHFSGYNNSTYNTAGEGGLLRSLPFLGGNSADPDALIDNTNRGDLLQQLREAGSIRIATAGRSSDLGFSAPDAAGQLQGIDIEIARAIAVAIFGDAASERITFSTAESLPNLSDAFTAVANGDVDLALRGITANLLRDATAGIDFSDAYIETSVMLLVPEALAITRSDQLTGSSIGVIGDTTATERIRLELARTGTKATITGYPNQTALYEAFIAGEVDAIARDGVMLGTFQQALAALEQPINTMILDAQISYEPLSAVVDEHQSPLKDLVNTVIAILKQAAINNVTAANVQEQLTIAKSEQSGSALRLLFQLDKQITNTVKPLNTEIITAIIQTVGNIDEIRNKSFKQANDYVAKLRNTMSRPL